MHSWSIEVLSICTGKEDLKEMQTPPRSLLEGWSDQTNLYPGISKFSLSEWPTAYGVTIKIRFRIQTPSSAQPGLGTQSRYEAPGEIQLVIAENTVINIRSGYLGCPLKNASSNFTKLDNVWCPKKQMLMLLVAKLGIFHTQQESSTGNSKSISVSKLITQIVYN